MAERRILDPEKLDRLVEQYGPGYAGADPYPHCVIDDFLPPDVLDEVLEQFPGPEDEHWHRFDRGTEKKLATTEAGRFPPAILRVLHELNGSLALRFIERLTGIEHLIPDPHFRGGGMHQIEPGGFLKVHVDFSKHEEWGLDRRLNLLVYLNKDWEEDYGGHLQVWDTKMEHCVNKVLPVFNRCVIFSTTDKSWHGHPDPLTCPPDRTRKSLALYYYTVGRGDVSGTGETFPTQFRERPGERIPGVAWRVSQNLLPPVLWRALKKTRDRLKGG